MPTTAPRAGRPGSTGKIARAQRRTKILELRAGGMSIDSIAEKLGTTERSVYSVIQHWLKKQEQRQAENLDAIRALQIERLDAMLRALWPKVKKGNLGAIDRALKIEAQRAKLLGTEQRQESDDKGGDVHFHFGTSAEIEQLTRAWRAGVIDGTATEVPQDAGSPALPSAA